MFFCLLETLTPASLQQIGMAHSQMRFLLAAWGEKKRSPITTILHDSELSHPCSPTFPLISFRDPARWRFMLVCVFVHMRLVDLHWGSMSLLVPLHLYTKIKTLCWFSVAYWISFKHAFIDQWNLLSFGPHWESDITFSTESMHWV